MNLKELEKLARAAIDDFEKSGGYWLPSVDTFQESVEPETVLKLIAVVKAAKQLAGQADEHLSQFLPDEMDVLLDKATDELEAALAALEE
jgi:hypothetical protein